MRYRRLKGDQRRRGAVLIISRAEKQGNRDAVDLLEQLFGCYGRGEQVAGSIQSQIVYRSGECWKAWTEGQATQCLRPGVKEMSKLWSEQGRGMGARLVLEEFALHSGRIGEATRQEAKGASSIVTQREGGWKLNAFMGYARGNMEDPRWVSRVLKECGDEESQPPGE